MVCGLLRFCKAELLLRCRQQRTLALDCHGALRRRYSGQWGLCRPHPSLRSIPWRLLAARLQLEGLLPPLLLVLLLLLLLPPLLLLPLPLLLERG